MKYRSEIDGLRALAVVPVILYHAHLRYFSGGFVGVDIFFVISGYLITTIVISDIDVCKFSILNFYERRARRILPALFVVLIVTTGLSLFWLAPDDMKSLSESLSAASIFGSNLLFWRTGGYFDTSAELKPLIHTWSLSVEEQYYIIFPPFLIFLSKFSRKIRPLALGLLALFSFILAVGMSETNPAFDFYVLPTRAWEILIGALLSIYLSENDVSNCRPSVSNFLSGLGLTLILIPVFAYGKNWAFPLYALAPTFGSALIIVFANRNTFTGRLLSTRIFVTIGLISFSAYLWHQPIFALARLRSLGEPTLSLMGIFLLLSFGLAYCTWRFIERPFRNRSMFTQWQIFTFSSACAIAIFSFGLFGYVSDGFPGRYSSAQAEYAQYFENSIPQWRYFQRTHMLDFYRDQCNFYNIKAYRSGYATNAPNKDYPLLCYKKDKDKQKYVFLWGDSHAQQLFAGLEAYLPKNWQILQVTSSGCSPKLDALPSKTNYCNQSNWFAWEQIREQMPNVVVVAQESGHNIETIKKIRDALEAIGIQKIIFTGPSPHWDKNLPDIVAFRLWGHIPKRTFLGLNRKFIADDRELAEEFPQDRHSIYLSIMDDFCNSVGCQVYLGKDAKAGITTWDYGHLTPIASRKFSKDILVPAILGLGG